MEGISASLQPYKELVASAASFFTIAQFFSGSIVCRDIYKKKSTKGTSAIPFIGGVVMGIITLKYGFLLSDDTIINVNVVAIVLNTIYSVFYYQYAQNKYEEVLKPLAFGVGLAAFVLGYAAVESNENIEFRFGIILTLLLLGLLGAPLASLPEIVAKKDASSIPFPITFMGAIVTFLWFTYGIILQNNFMIVQNLVGFILCMVQLVLLFWYPGDNSSSEVQSKKKSPKGKKGN